MKHWSKKNRITKGNEDAEKALAYINKRFNKKYDNYEGTYLDMTKKADFGKGNISFQAKVRVSKYGNDIIYEACKFIPEGKSLKPPFKLAPGRDADGISDYTICLPVIRDGYRIPKTKAIKMLVLKAFKKWEKENDNISVEFIEKNGQTCPVVKVNDKILKKWLEICQQPGKWGKSKAYEDVYFWKIGDYEMKLQFKIEEGKDDAAYAKILAYIPAEFFKDCPVILFKEGEIWDESSSWHKYSGEKLEEII